MADKTKFHALCELVRVCIVCVYVYIRVFVNVHSGGCKIYQKKKLHFFNMCPPQYEPVLKYIFLEVTFHAL